MVQLGNNNEMVPLHGMCGKLDAELEALRAHHQESFLCFLRKAHGPTMVHVDKKGITDVLWRGEMRCIGPNAKDADLRVLIWEELHRVHPEDNWCSSKRVLLRR